MVSSLLDAYFVCATPRTGSSLLLGLLDSTGVAGHPQAYFRVPDEELWARRWRLASDADYGDYVRAALTHGRTGNGVFGAKLMWGTLEEMLGKLTTGTPGPGLGLIERTFGATRFVHLRRDDVVAQAVSWLRAEQTGAWFAGGHGEISGTADTGRAPAYDATRITELIRTIDEHTAAWAAWFASAGVEPTRVRYEDLAADPAGTVGELLDRLGLELPAGQEIVARHRRQGDDLNREWARRYRTDQQS